MGRALHDGRDAARAGGSCWTFQFRRNQSNQGRGGYAVLHILISYKPTLAITHEHNINCSGPKVPNTNLLQPDCGFGGEPDDLLLIGAALAWQEDGGGQAGARASVFFFFLSCSLARWFHLNEKEMLESSSESVTVIMIL